MYLTINEMHLALRDATTRTPFLIQIGSDQTDSPFSIQLVDP